MIISNNTSLVHDMKNLYNNLVKNGYYDLFHLQNYNPNTICNTKRSDGITISTKSNINITYINAPCLSCNEMKICSCINKNLYEYSWCPLCCVINRYYDSPCKPITKFNCLLFDNHIIMPNGFPYFQNQFLITYEDHKTQTLMQENRQIFYDILKIADIICNNDTIMWFNGTYGNNIEHFHVHFGYLYLVDNERTWHSKITVPIFNYVDANYDMLDNVFCKYNDITIKIIKSTTQNNFFNGLLIECNEIILLSNVVFEYFTTITILGYAYNFILRKKNNTFQIIVFVRKNTKTCNQLNLGGLDLSGIIIFGISPKVTSDTLEQEYLDYVNTTNNIDDIY